MCFISKLKIGVNDLETKFPDIAKEWDYEKNILSPKDFCYSSNKKVWWTCKEGHNYQRNINDRTNQGQGCPYCSGHKTLKGYNDFGTHHPDLLAEWDFDKNTVDPFEISKSNGKKVWWICEKGHHYEASIAHRVNMKSGCPYCNGKKVLKGFNDFGTLYPELLGEWDYEKNKNIDPFNITSKSPKSVWWKCKFGHRWKTAIAHRTLEHTGCPICKKASKGEEILAKEFDKRGIKYERQYTFDKCKNIFVLPFDFYLPDYDVLIEYDGKQHFEPVEIFGGEKEFIKQQKRDRVKDDFCENNNQVLMRISYKNLTKLNQVVDKIHFICEKIRESERRHNNGSEC